MRLFGRSTHTPHMESRVLVDVGAHSIAGGYVWYPQTGTPTLCYGKRVPIVAREGELQEAALERSLEVLGEAMVREGVPALMRTVGSGQIGSILVSIDAPWQMTSVRVEEVVEEKRFTLTRHKVGDMLAHSRPIETEDRRITEHVVDIRVNGYQTKNPYGKGARRVTLTILTSSADTRAVSAVSTVIRRHFHRVQASYISGASLRYQVLRAAFPHERDVLILDAMDQGVTLSLVRGGTLAAVSEPVSIKASDWASAVESALAELATHYPLPHTILLIGEAADTTERAKALNTSTFSALWLTDNPPKIIVVKRSQFAPIERASEAVTDIRLVLMARYRDEA